MTKGKTTEPETYEQAVEHALRGDLKTAVELLSRCVQGSPQAYYNRLIQDIIQNFDGTLLSEEIRSEDNRILGSLPDALVEKYSKKFFRGEYVVRMGDLSSTFFIVVKGTVLITISGKLSEIPVALNYLGAGDFFGEMAVFVGGRRSANAVVVSKQAILLEINSEQFEEFIKRNPKFGMKIIATLCKRISKTNQILTELVESGIYTDARSFLDDR